MNFFNDPSQAMRVNEDLWFLVNQELLLAIANTEFGRDLLCIPREYPKIVKITKCSVHCLLKDDGKTATVLADFRVGAKWANIIRYRLGQFVSYSRYFDFRSPYIIRSLTGVSSLTSEKMAVSLSTLTTYPDPNPETSTFDGQVANDNPSYSTSHDATSATFDNNDSATFFYVINQGSWSIYRAMTLFDTSTLTSSATISAATLSVYHLGNNDPYSDSMRLTVSNPASNTGVSAADYNQANFGTTAQASDITKASMTVNAYIDYSLNGTGLGNVSKTGVSKFGFRLVSDINSYSGSPSNNYTQFRSADQAGTSNDPKLVVTYSISSGLLGIERTPIRGVMRGAMRP